MYSLQMEYYYALLLAFLLANGPYHIGTFLQHIAKVYKYRKTMSEIKKRSFEEESTSAPVATPPRPYKNKYEDKLVKMNRSWVYTEEDIKREYDEMDLRMQKDIMSIRNTLEDMSNELDDEDSDSDDKISYLPERPCATNTKTAELLSKFPGVSKVMMHEKDSVYVPRKELEKELATLENHVLAKTYPDSLIQCVRTLIQNRKLEVYKNSYVMEFTPVGNVVMIYSAKKESFEYYADKVIPYEFLEVVARKYVIANNCAQIYVRMGEEIKTYKIVNKSDSGGTNAGSGGGEAAAATGAEKQASSVFAKFKSYNRTSGGTSEVIKNSGDATKKTSLTPVKLQVELKNRINRYTYLGKICNFSFLKIPPKETVNAKMSVSFAEYKRKMAATAAAAIAPPDEDESLFSPLF